MMGKKHRNRNTPKKNNHISPAVLEAEETAHAKEHTSGKRKNGPGNNV